jgi:hypothetical protein
MHCIKSWANISEVDMLDVMALIAVLFIGLGLGGVAIAVFMYALEKMQNGGKK